MASQVTFAQFAETVGVTPSAISKAVRAGRLTAAADGLLDPVAAAAQWQHNRRRRQRMPKQPTVGEHDRAAPPGAAGDYWTHKTERESAEAAMARMREREMAGELVRKVEVERALAGKLIALRESLETLADRLSALVAAESDPAACRRILRDEIRQALAAFARADDGGGERDLGDAAHDAAS